MKEFIEKLIGRLEEEVEYQHEKADSDNGAKKVSLKNARNKMGDCYKHAIEIVNQLAEEYNNDFCEWKQEDEEGFSNCKFTYQEIMNDEVEGFKFCPYCGKKIKIAPYQQKGE